MKIKKIFIFLGFSVFILAGAFLAMTFRYFSDVEYSRGDANEVIFEVSAGDSISSVSDELSRVKLIRSKFSFELYSKLNSKSNIKAGKYSLNGKMKIPEILSVLNSGKVALDDQISVSFLPGGTVMSAKRSLKKLGYSDAEISEAFSYDYSGEFPALFEGKPKGSDLEGFLYGETHFFKKGTALKDILRRFFKDFEKKVVELDLSKGFKDRGFNLYQGITFASIVHRETLDDYQDKRMVAGVFYNRYSLGMNLGSDVTYQYIADKTGVPRDYNMDSPYNLRIKTGLTPTPIATPGIDSLKASINPSSHDYIYFLSGDDDKTYFGKTNAEHEKNIINHCKEKCRII